MACALRVTMRMAEIATARATRAAVLTRRDLARLAEAGPRPAGSRAAVPVRAITASFDLAQCGKPAPGADYIGRVAPEPATCPVWRPARAGQARPARLGGWRARYRSATPAIPGWPTTRA